MYYTLLQVLYFPMISSTVSLFALSLSQTREQCIVPLNYNGYESLGNYGYDVTSSTPL
jgi:hypothetical protein